MRASQFLTLKIIQGEYARARARASARARAKAMMFLVKGVGVVAHYFERRGTARVSGPLEVDANGRSEKPRRHRFVVG